MEATKSIWTETGSECLLLEVWTVSHAAGEYDYVRMAELLAGEASEAKVRFDALADPWEEDTRVLSSFSHARRHPLFQRLVDFGPLAVPWAKARLNSSVYWAAVLEAITGYTPYIPNPGSAEAIKSAWLDWFPDETAAA